MAPKSLSELASQFAETTQKNEKSKFSWAWYMNKAKEVRSFAAKSTEASAKTILSDDDTPKAKKSQFTASQSKDGVVGKMIMFQYDPKTKDKLPYYDIFPVGFPLEIYPDGYLMINLHYLPTVLRASLMDALYSFMINKKEMNENSRLNISYELLKNAAKAQMFRPCVKRYLFNHVKSKWSIIKPEEWEMACFLPTQRFVGAGQNKVWSDSQKKIRKAAR